MTTQSTVMLNVRIPVQLKERGAEVLGRSRVSVSDAVRALFEEMERTQELPECVVRMTQRETVDDRRAQLRHLVGRNRPKPESLEEPALPEGEDWRAYYRRHLLEKSLGEGER